MDTQNRLPRLPIQFNGKAGEYFGIWIVNVFLTLITLGLYSPWAKIRQKRYFYGSTQLSGASFDYAANPWSILKGRLIAVVVVVGFSICAEFAPWVNGLFSLFFVAALPWLIIRTRRFNAVNTVYRNLRFGFDATYGKALGSFVFAPMMLGLTLGLAQPWVKRKQMKLVVDHSSYGTTPFCLDASLGDFFFIFKRYIGVLLTGMIPVGMVLAILWPDSVHAGAGADQAANKLLAVLIWPLILWAMVLSVYLDLLTSNLVYSKTRLGDIPLYCEMRFWPLLGLYLGNILGVAFSFGLLIPWAKVRMARYRLGCMGLLCTADALQGFTAAEAKTVTALGEELSDILDVDIGL